MTPVEIYEDMLKRCWEVDTIDRTEVLSTNSAGVGHMLLSQSGHILAIEVGIDNGGNAFASVRMFDPDGEPIAPIVMDSGPTLMAVTP